jgi:hypothetical protein
LRVKCTYHRVMELRTLEDIVRRADLMIVDVIVQDEYTHDIVVADGARFLVFDAT